MVALVHLDAPRRSGRRRCRPGSAPTSGPGTPCRSTCPRTAGHPFVGKPDQFVAVQPHRSGDLGVLGQQSDDRHRAGRLARAGFADERDDLARVDVESSCRAPRRPLRMSVEKVTVRSRTSRRRHVRRLRRGRRAGIERVAQPVANEVGAQHDQHQHAGGEQEHPRERRQPTGCRRRSACPATHRAAGCRNRGS